MHYGIGNGTAELSVEREGRGGVYRLRLHGRYPEGRYPEGALVRDLNITIDVAPESFGRMLYDPDYTVDCIVSGMIKIEEG